MIEHVNAYNISKHIKVGAEIALNANTTLMAITNTLPQQIPIPEETFITITDHGETYVGSIHMLDGDEVSLCFVYEEFQSVQDCVYQILNYNKMFPNQKQ